MVSMNRLQNSDRVRIVACLVEGMSIRSTCRITGFAKGTVLKLLADLGETCQILHDERVKELRTARLECDEIWSFCYAKKKNTPEHLKDNPEVGDVWTWTAIDADSKLMVSWLVADRNNASADAIMLDLSGRIVSERVQLTSDGLRWYKQAVQKTFDDAADYSELQKIYGAADGSPNTRYSPAVCIGCVRKSVLGNPDPEHISTSYVERANLTMRMGMRRFTRLTNGFSKKHANHCAAVALHFAHYNFCRVHTSLGKRTPAMAAGIADHPWSIEELVSVLEGHEREIIGTEGNRRGPYKKRISN